MAYATLRDYIQALDAAGELHRVCAPVSPILEITQIADRISKSPAPTASEHAKAFDPRFAYLGGKALLFEDVEGASFPLAINTFGSYHRMELALGCTDGGFEALAQKIAKLTKPEPPTRLIEKLKKIPELAKIASYPPKVVRSGICQQVVQTRRRGQPPRPARHQMLARRRGPPEIQLPGRRVSQWDRFRGRERFRGGAVHYVCGGSIPSTPRRATATWACTGCRY